MSDRSHFIYEVDESWSLFLDRDGVINERKVGGYVQSISEFEILPGVLEALFHFDGIFQKIFVVTNQQGIGKGIMSHEDLALIHEYFLHEVANARGRIDDIYYSPDLSNMASFTRKPQIGMALQACEDYKTVDLSKSIMVGDSLSDMQFGRNAGMYNVLAGKKKDEVQPELYDLRVEDLIGFSVLLQRALSK